MALSDGTYVKEEEPRRPVAPSRGHDMPSNDPPSSSLLLGASLLQDDQSETKVRSKIQIRDGAEGGRGREDRRRQSSAEFLRVVGRSNTRWRRSQLASC